MRDSCLIYRSFYEAIIALPAENQSEVWKAVFEYSLNFNEIELTGINKSVFTLIKPIIDSNIKKYKVGAEGGRLGGEHGHKGGRPKPPQNPHKTPTKPPRNPQETPTKPPNVDVDVDEEINKGFVFQTKEFEDAWNGFVEFRKKIKKPLTTRAEKLNQGKLFELCNGDEQTAIAIVNQSVEKGWQSFYALKNDTAEQPAFKLTTSKLTTDEDRHW